MSSEQPASPPSSRYPDSDEFPTGPEVGQALPDFTLLDQHGEPVTFSEARGGNRALVVFHRSARW